MDNTINKTTLKKSILFITFVLVTTYGFAYYVFLRPETIQLYVLGMFIPAIVAFILNYIRYKSIKLVFKPISARINLKSVLFSLLYPLLFIGIIALVVYSIGIAKLDKANLSNLTQLPTLEMIIIGFLLMFGEEYGWRGSLLKELSEAKGKIFGALVVGVVWALWHAPFIYGLANFTNMENPLLLTVIQMGAVFVFSIPFAYSYFLTNNKFGLGEKKYSL